MPVGGAAYIPGAGNDSVVVEETGWLANDVDHVNHTGGGGSEKPPARLGSGDALFEYQEAPPWLYEVRGSVLFEYQMFDWP